MKKTVQIIGRGYKNAIQEALNLFVVWSFDNGVCEYPVNCESCKLVGQSHDITEYPNNCLFMNDIKDYEHEQMMENMKYLK